MYACAFVLVYIFGYVYVCVRVIDMDTRRIPHSYYITTNCMQPLEVDVWYKYTYNYTCVRARALLYVGVCMGAL